MLPYGLSHSELRAINIISFISLVITNIVIGSIFAKPNLCDIADQHPTFLTASTWVIGVYWGIELLLLSGFLVVQYSSDLAEIIGEGISLWFAVANFLMSAWVYFWLNSRFTIAYFFLAIQFLILFSTLHNLRFFFHHHIMTSRLAFYFIYAPISSYVGWMFVDVIYSIFVTYTDNKSQTYATIAIVTLWAIETFGAYIAHGRFQNPFIPLSIGFYLFGIALNQDYDAHPALVISGYATAGLLYVHAAIAGVHIALTKYDYEPLLDGV